MIKSNKHKRVVKEKTTLQEGSVPAGTKIFTEYGWKNIEEVKVGDKIYTLDLKSNTAEMQPIIKTIKTKYKGDMIQVFDNIFLDIVITKKHKVVIWDKNDKIYTLTGIKLYEKIKNNDKKTNLSYIKRSTAGLDEGESDRIYLNTVYVMATKILFNDFVYCVSVKNKTWLMKYNDKICWTHNCDIK